MKKDLRSVPLEKLLVAKEKRLAVIKELKISSNSSWLMPQISTYISGMRLVRNKGKIDPIKFLEQNFDQDDWHRGLWILLNHPNRGEIIREAQYSSAYAALVPLVLMPFKKFHNIPYSDWDRESVHTLMYPKLAEAVEFGEKVDYSTEELLEFRRKGLYTKTGSNAGTYKDPVTQWNLSDLGDTEFGKLPKFVQVMCTQIWCAHPQNRTQYMILDWVNLDQMPEPLIPTELL